MKRLRLLFGMAVLLCLVMAVMAVPAFGGDGVQSGTCGADVYWSFYPDGTLVIGGVGPMDDYYASYPDGVVDTDVPWPYHKVTVVRIEQGVTSIGSYAFAYHSKLTSVSFPEGLASIGESAFYDCDGLVSVTLQEGLTSIGRFAFESCNNLTSVTLPQGLADIGAGAFRNCTKLESVTLPQGLTDIHGSVFTFCGSLTDVTLPDGLITIGSRAFSGCSSLTEMTIPSSVTTIAGNAFEDCYSMQGFWVDSRNQYFSNDDRGVLFNRDMTTLQCAPGGIIGAYTIPQGVTGIAGSAFYGCHGLTSVVIPEGITQIGDDAFSDCDNLISVSLPATLTSWNTSVFTDCIGLQSFDVNPRNASFSTDDRGVLFSKDGKTLIQAPQGIYGHYTVPDGVTSIGKDAFFRCVNLTGVSIPAGVKSIASRAFYQCKRLASITISEGLNRVETEAFGYCFQLKTLVFAGDMPGMGFNAFYDENSVTCEDEFVYTALDPVLYYPAGNRTWNDDIDVKKQLLGSPIALEVVGIDNLFPYYITGDTLDENSIAAVLVYDSGAKVWLSPEEVTLSGCDTSGVGIKTISVSARGFTATARIYVHPGQWLDTADCDVRHGSGDYRNGDTQILTIPGADEIQITFGGCTYLKYYISDDGYDTRVGSVAVYDGTGQEVGFYSAMRYHEEPVGETVTVQGDTVKIEVFDGQYYLKSVKARQVEHNNASEGGACSICDGTYVCVHSYDRKIIAQATCDTEGEIVYTCSSCGHSYSEVLPATGHDFGAWEQNREPSCTADGQQERTCGNCGRRETKVIAATGHAYSQWMTVKEVTCTQNGEQKRTCSNCGDSEIRTNAATGHNYGRWEVSKAATCTSDGQEKRTCGNCGDSEIRTIAAIGHNFGEWTLSQAPTCTADGQQKRTCANCSLTEKRTVAATGHNYRNDICQTCGQQKPGTVVVPAVPQIKSCYSKAQTSVKVTWTTVSGADGYELWRSTNPNDPNSWSRAKSILSGTTDRYTNQGLTVGVTYYYKIRSFVLDKDGLRVCSDFSNVDYMPAAVIFDEPYSNATYRIRLRWEEVGGSHGYQIWRLDGDGTWRIVKTLGDKGNTLTNDQGGTTAYSNTGLTAGGQYTYRMRAFRITSDGRKVFGAYSEDITVAVKPNAPTLSVTCPKSGRAKLEWSAVNGAAGYQIWMSTSPNGGFQIIKSITNGATSYTKTDLVPGKTYYFQIRAYAEVEGKKTFSAFSPMTSIQIR